MILVAQIYLMVIGEEFSLIQNLEHAPLHCIGWAGQRRESCQGGAGAPPEDPCGSDNGACNLRLLAWRCRYPSDRTDIAEVLIRITATATMLRCTDWSKNSRIEPESDGGDAYESQPGMRVATTQASLRHATVVEISRRLDGLGRNLDLTNRPFRP